MLVPAPYSSEDVQVLDTELIYAGHIRLFKHQLRYRLFAGGWSQSVIRELYQSRPAAGVLLFDPHRDEIVLVEEFRLGALGKTGSPWLVELVAGLIEEGETVQEVAYREAQEEAGCQVIDLMPICEYWTSPGISTGKFTLFCGKINAARAGGIFGLAAENEDIRAHVFPKQVVYQALSKGYNNHTYIIFCIFNEKQVTI
jgi:ADP-ribose pyrophosphatase